MANYKYQHYLPSGHQKFFSSENGSQKRVCKYSKIKQIVYTTLQKPKNQGGRKHLYSLPDGLVTSDEQKTYLEQKYFCHDGQFINVINKLISNTEINETDVYQITKYIANINNRNPFQLDNKEKDIKQLALEHIFGHDSKLIDLFKAEDVEFVPQSGEDFRKISSLQNMMRSIVENLHELCNISMNILVSDRDEFILSDTPFVGMANNLSLISTTSLTPECNYFLPLTKNICAHLNGEGQNLNSYFIDSDRVQIINNLQISSAKEFVIASSVEVLQANLERSGVIYETMHL